MLMADDDGKVDLLSGRVRTVISWLPVCRSELKMAEPTCPEALYCHLHDRSQLKGIKTHADESYLTDAILLL